MNHNSHLNNKHISIFSDLPIKKIGNRGILEIIYDKKLIVDDFEQSLQNEKWEPPKNEFSLNNKLTPNNSPLRKIFYTHKPVKIEDIISSNKKLKNRFSKIFNESQFNLNADFTQRDLKSIINNHDKIFIKEISDKNISLSFMNKKESKSNFSLPLNNEKLEKSPKKIKNIKNIYNKNKINVKLKFLEKEKQNFIKLKSPKQSFKQNETNANMTTHTNTLVPVSETSLTDLHLSPKSIKLKSKSKDMNLYKALNNLPNIYKECSYIQKTNKTLDNEFNKSILISEKKSNEVLNKIKLDQVKEFGEVKFNELPKTFIYGKRDGGFIEDLEIIKRSKMLSLANPEAIYNINVNPQDKVHNIMEHHKKIMKNKKSNHDKVKDIINSLELSEKEAKKRIEGYLHK